MKFERIIWAMVVGALIALLCFRECTRPKPCGTARKIDTAWVKVTDTIAARPVPAAVSPYKKQVTPGLPALTEPAATHICPADYLTDNPVCNDTAFYTETYNIKTDTTHYGTIAVRDTVTGNRITGRSVIPSLNIPVVTITDTVEKKVTVSRFQLYIGLGATGNKATIGIGPSVLVKTKKDQAFTAGAYFTRNGWQYNATIYKKISFNFLKPKK